MKIVVLAGETSGDNYGALLVENIRKLSSGVFIAGTGGEKMKKRADLFIEGLPCGTMGFSGVLKNIHLFYRSFKEIRKAIEDIRPDLIILIDNPGFNLKMAQALGKKFPVCYYIPPKIWAHNYGRIKTIKKYVRAVIPIFDFEEGIYRKEGIPCRWFGHPAVDLISSSIENPERKKVGGNVPVVGLLPGSRHEEVAGLLPVFIRTVRLLKQKMHVEVLLSAADAATRKTEAAILKEYGEELEIIEGAPQPLIKNSDLLLAASGTVNLEAALAEKPLIVFYKTSALNYLLARIMVKLDFISPVNLLYGEKIVPEYVQRFPYDRIAEDCADILKRGKIYSRQAEKFRALKEKTGRGNVSAKVSEFLLGMAEARNPQETEIRGSGLGVPRKEKTGQAGKTKAGKSTSEYLNPNR